MQVSKAAHHPLETSRRGAAGLGVEKVVAWKKQELQLSKAIDASLDCPLEGQKRGGDEADEASTLDEGRQLEAEKLELQVKMEDPLWKVGEEELHSGLIEPSVPVHAFR